ncbi:unnamed protein product, partial [Mesorhabditis belari]|uniref:Uncharacterized protein n=1 Tax=Mesorhabditis belari TaxID=2138241 RepID=A0AAF3J6L2_9BILA
MMMSSELNGKHLNKSSWPVFKESHAATLCKHFFVDLEALRMSVTPNPSKKPIVLGAGDPTLVPGGPRCDYATEALIRATKTQKHDGYHFWWGGDETREAVAEHSSTQSTKYSANDVIITIGGGHALELFVTGVANPGDNILFPEACYRVYETYTRAYEVEFRGYQLNIENGLIDLEDLERKIDNKTKAILMNNPHNPLGAVYPKEHLEQLLRIAEKHHLPVLADEIYGNLVFGEEKFWRLTELEPNVPIITLNALSKSYLVPGWRCGWLLLRDHQGSLSKVWQGMRKLTLKALGVSSVIEGALPDILQNTPQKYFDDLNDRLKKNAQLFYDLLVKVPEVDFLKGLIEEEAVTTMPGSLMGLPGYFRVILLMPEEAIPRLVMEEECKPNMNENGSSIQMVQQDNEENDSEQEETSPYYQNHLAASNKPYTWPENYKDPNDCLSDEDDAKNIIDESEVNDDRPPFVRPSIREDAPLASILNEHLDGVDPRQWFPEFSPTEVLRFSRLFAHNIKPSFKTELWWTSKSFIYKSLTAEQRAQLRAEEKEKQEAILKGELRQTSNLRSLSLAEPSTNPDDYQVDQETLLLRPAVQMPKEVNKQDEEKREIAPWRLGPAKSLYDEMGVPLTATSVDYGFNLKKEDLSRKKPDEEAEESTKERSSAFLPVNLINWENDIVMDGEQYRQKLIDELKTGKPPLGGWFPTLSTRTYEHFTIALKQNYLPSLFAQNPPPQRLLVPDPDLITEPTPTHSIFPLEFVDNTNWEKDVIIDVDNMERLPEPKMLTLDFFDDPLIFGMPEDHETNESIVTKIEKKDNNLFTKKSKMILGQVQQRQKQEEEEEMERMTDKDPFNLSNDDYYNPKNTDKSGPTVTATQILHSLPAQNVHQMFFPTHLGISKLRHWHRQPLNKRIMRNIGSKFVPIKPLTQHIQQMNEMRERKRQIDGGGEVFLMREIQDLSGRDGELLLLEYSEEHPPLLSQTGMASKLRNYYKRKTGKEHDLDFEYGETAFTHIPFLGILQPGQSLQSIENNLFRAPIYRHATKRTDFLLIHQKGSWYIRQMPPTFVVGQECPLYEVPSPNSKRAAQFVRDSLMASIYRLFWESNEDPRKIKIEDLKAAFPHYAEGSLRKRLKVCADFKRLGPGPEHCFWILRPDFRLPSKEEVLAMVTPEMYCAQYSMLATEQRLKDAGYGERYFFTPENEEESNDEVTIEDEIKAAPWNTTRAYIWAMRGKCLLDQTGIADPTGCGQGFSYVRVSAKPPKEEGPTVPKRLVTGTNADLRKLPLKEAKQICREYGVREEEISALSRWEIIDVIRTLSTQAAKGGGENPDVAGMARFARGNSRHTMLNLQEKNRRHNQRIFELQAKNLSNPEELSTDEGSGDENSDNEDMANRLETMLKDAKDRTNTELDRQRKWFEEEEKELQELKEMLRTDPAGPSADAKLKTEALNITDQDKNDAAKLSEEIVGSASKISGITGNKKLKIYRTFRDEDGNESVRTETITRPQLVEAYIRIRSTRNEDFIKVYAMMDEQFKEERRKERRKLQDQLRRLKRYQATAPKTAPKKEKKEVPKKENHLKTRCSACNQIGHMKSNRNCPLFGKSPITPGFKDTTDDEVSMSGTETMPGISTDSLVELEGTIMRIKKSLFPSSKKPKEDQPENYVTSEATSSKSFLFEDDFGDFEGNLQRAIFQQGIKGETDYLQGPTKNAQRARANPKISMATILMEIVSELRNMPGIEPLLKPVNAKMYSDYYKIIERPMDVQKIKEKIQDNKYELRMDFLCDVKKILDNTLTYNGAAHPITQIAQKMFELAAKRVVEKESRLVQLEKQINPLLDDNDRVGFSFILTEIVQKLKNIPKSSSFHQAVDGKKVPRYYMVIKRPMDLQKIENNAKKHWYTRVEKFENDIKLIYENSKEFNGAASPYTTKAEEIVVTCQQLLAEKAEQLHELECSINASEPQMIKEHDDEEELDEHDRYRFYENLLDKTTEEPGQEAGGPGEAIAHEETAQQGLIKVEPRDEEMDISNPAPSTSVPARLSLVDYDDDDSQDAPLLDEDALHRALLESDMHASGQLNADLALSDSDDESLTEAKRPRFEEDPILEAGGPLGTVGQPCNPDPDQLSCSVQNSECVEGVCLCKQFHRFHATNGSCIHNEQGSTVGQNCRSGAECRGRGEFCSSFGVCMCLSTHVDSGTQCKPTVYPGQSGCDDSRQCNKGFPGAFCDRAQICQCPNGMISQQQTCLTPNALANMIMADPQPAPSHYPSRMNGRGSQSIGNLQRTPPTYSRRRPFNQETHQNFFKRLQQPASNNRFGVQPDGLCAVDSDCAGYPMSYCDGVCKCINGALNAGSTCVAGAPALSAATCSSGQIYVTEAGSCMTSQNPGEPCQYSQQCSANEPGAFCLKLKCECVYGMQQSGAGCTFVDSQCPQRGFIWISELGACKEVIPPGGKGCSHNLQCQAAYPDATCFLQSCSCPPEFPIAIDGTCGRNCSAGTTFSGITNTCLPTVQPGDQCIYSSQCHAIHPGMICDRNRCNCPNGQVFSGNQCTDSCPQGYRVNSKGVCAQGCAPTQIDFQGECLNQATPGQQCLVNAQCTGGSSCQSGICVCPLATVSSGGVCMPVQSPPLASCANGEQCSGGSFCVSGNCSCPLGQSVLNGQCVTPIAVPPNSPCNPSVSCGGGSSCVNSVCVCSTSLVVIDETCSLPPTVNPGGPCPSGLERCLGQSSCINGVCACPFGTTIQNAQCVPIAAATPGSPCGPATTCQGLAVCIDSMCRCPYGMTIQGGECRAAPSSDVGSSCLNDEVCIGGSVCLNGICSCPIGTRAIQGICTAIASAQPGQTCASGEVCTGGSNCQQGVCVCPIGTINFQGYCVTTSMSLGACNNSLQCPGGSFCDLSRNLCICPGGSMAIGDRCVSIQEIATKRQKPAYFGCKMTSDCPHGRVCFEGKCICEIGQNLNGDCIITSRHRDQYRIKIPIAPQIPQKPFTNRVIVEMSKRAESRKPISSFQQQIATNQLTNTTLIRNVDIGSACVRVGVTCGGGSICVSGYCVCPLGTLPHHNKCVEKSTAKAGESCAQGEDCTGGSQCNQHSQICECMNPLQIIIGGRCENRLRSHPGYPCSNGEVCVGGSECLGGRCECTDGRVNINKQCVYRPDSKPGMSCGNGERCTGNSECEPTTKKCSCPKGMQSIDDVCTAFSFVGPGESCLALNARCGGQSYCVRGTCQCAENMVALNRKCSRVKQALPGSKCSQTENCVGRSVCKDGSCVCMNPLILNRNRCETARNVYPGETCRPGDHCLANASCKDGLCVCPLGQMMRNGRCEMKRLISPGFLCSRDDVCIGFSTCQNGLCSCPIGQIIVEKRCEEAVNALPGQECGKNIVCTGGSKCLEGMCVCGTDQRIYGNRCQDVVRVAPEASCGNGEVCTGGSTCDRKHRVCRCPQRQFARQGKCVPIVVEINPLRKSTQITTTGTTIDSREIEESTTLKPTTFHRYRCYKSSDCKGGAVCTYGMCVCPQGMVMNKRRKCEPASAVEKPALLLRECSSSSQCSVENSFCDRGQCKCLPGYRIFGSTQCIPRTTTSGTELGTTPIATTTPISFKTIPPRNRGNKEMTTTQIAANLTLQTVPPRALPGWPCNPNTNCLRGSYCVNGFCKCPPGFVELEGMCKHQKLVPPLSSCAHGEICTRGSNCTLGFCFCQQGFMLYKDYCVSFEDVMKLRELEKEKHGSTLVTVTFSPLPPNLLSTTEEPRIFIKETKQRPYGEIDNNLMPKEVESTEEPESQTIASIWTTTTTTSTQLPTTNFVEQQVKITYPGKWCDDVRVFCSNGSTCVNSVCQCRHDLILSEDRCISPLEARRCIASNQCPSGAECVRGRCVCPQGMALSRFGFCIPIVYVDPGMSCAEGEQCRYGSKCSDGMCTCQEGLILSQDNKCLPPISELLANNQMHDDQPNNLHGIINKKQRRKRMKREEELEKRAVGDGCLSDGDCLTPTSCLDAICRCPPTHFQSGNACIDKNAVTSSIALPGEQCTANDVCDGGAVCVQEICKCPSGMLPEGPFCFQVSSKVNERCDGGEMCINGSICLDGLCICPSGYHEVNTGCVKKKVARQNVVTNCAINPSICTGGSYCSNGICVCPYGQSFVNGVCTTGGGTGQSIQYASPGAACIDGSTRCLGNSICINNFCICPGGEQIRNGLCMPIDSDASPGDMCQQGITTCSGNSICLNNVCRCPTNQVNLNGQCSNVLQANVVSNCGNCPINSQCVQNQCQCNTGYQMSSTSNMCLRYVYPGQSCDSTSYCQANSACQSGVCTCNPGYAVTQGLATSTCIQAANPGDYCNNNVPCGTNSQCLLGQCACNQGFAPSSTGSFCAQITQVGQPCSQQSVCTANSQCQNGFCMCNTGYSATSGQCVTYQNPISNQCPNGCPTNSFCFNGNCQCMSGYNPTNDGSGCTQQCLNGQQCSPPIQILSCQQGYSYDSTTNQCIRVVALVSAPQQACGINGPCGDNSYCNQGQCLCNNGYYNSGFSSTNSVNCQPVALANQACQSPNACTLNSACSQGICQCNNGYYSNSGYCQPLLSANQPCQSSNGCTQNSACIQGFCQCNNGYSNNGGYCLPATNQQCQTTSDCSQNAYCQSGSCQCNNGYYSNGGYCQPLIPSNQPCQSGSCGQNSICTSSGTCQCNQGFYDNGGSCQALILPNQPCQNSMSCIQNSACSSGTCQCNSGFYNNGAGCTQQGSYAYPGQTCQNGQICQGGSRCDGTVCRCPFGFFPSGQQCIPANQDPGSFTQSPNTVILIPLGSSCDPRCNTNYCNSRCGNGGICSNTNVCTCPIGYAQIGTTCSTNNNNNNNGGCPGCGNPMPGDRCNNTSPCSGGSVCVLGVCSCPAGYGPSADGTSCQQSNNFGALTLQRMAKKRECFSDTECAGGMICSAKSCICPSGSSLVDGVCTESFSGYQKKAPVYPGSFCSSTSQCQKNSQCFLNRCVCVGDRVTNTTGHCVGPFEVETRDVLPGSRCSIGGLPCQGVSVCDQGYCVCPLGTETDEEPYCSRTTGEDLLLRFAPNAEALVGKASCSSYKDCKSPRICAETKKCECPFFMKEDSRGVCLLFNDVTPGASCDFPSARCVNGSECLAGICACQPPLLLQDQACSSPTNNVLPGALCMSSNECTFGSECVNNICKCPFGVTNHGEPCSGSQKKAKREISENTVDDLRLRPPPTKNATELTDCPIDGSCKLPGCFCSKTGTVIPGGLNAKDTPQMIILTFDDPITDRTINIYKSLFDGRIRNPNSCPIKGTFFISHQWNNYDQAQWLYSRGNEIALNSITHETLTTATEQRWRNEMSGLRESLKEFSYVEQESMRGIRAPQLLLGGDNQFAMMQQAGFTYDNSMPLRGGPYWPQTLDHKMAWECEEQNCPTKPFKGLWELPINQLISTTGKYSAMARSAIRPFDSRDAVANMLKRNFLRHYKGNRAPFVITADTDFLTILPDNGAVNALSDFLNDVLNRTDVYVVTATQAIEWMRRPTKVSEIQRFQPWQCQFHLNDHVQPCESPSVCSYSSSSIQGGVPHSFRICGSCPLAYPWIENPLGKRLLTV